MQLKTSYFNATLFRKNLSRFWPMWGMASFGGALFPLALFVQLLDYRDSMEALEVREVYYGTISYALPIMSLIYAILCAVAVWSYLYNARSVGAMHTMPIRREGLFVTNFLSGMAMMLIPYAVTGLLFVLVTLCFGGFDLLGTVAAIGAVLAESFFYFSSATLVAFITGNLLGLPVLYGILHFLAVMLDALLSLFAQGFLFGLSGTYSGAVEFLSPTVYLMEKVRVLTDYREVYNAEREYYTSELMSVGMANGWLIGVYALAGVVLLAAAYLLYRNRRSETAGEVVSVAWMKPIFRYGVTFCGGMLGGLGLYYLFWHQFQNSWKYDILPVLICVAVAGTISYYIATMLLEKSMRVFRGSAKGLSVGIVGLVVVCCAMNFDVFGMESRVPEIDDIQMVEFQAGENNYEFVSGAEDDLIEQMRTVHQAMIADEEYVTQMNQNWTYGGATESEQVSFYNYVRLVYTLKNGGVVTRKYRVPLTQTRIHEPDTYDYLLDTFLNSQAMKLKRIHADPQTSYVPMSVEFYSQVRGKHHSFGSVDAQNVLTALKRDAMAGNWGQTNWFEQSDAYEYTVSLHLDFEHPGEGNTNRRYYDSIYIRMTPAMTETRAALLAMSDKIKESDFVTRMELNPDEYGEEDRKYYETVYARFTNPNSVGIIGGADGPTQVIVASAGS